MILPDFKELDKIRNFVWKSPQRLGIDIDGRSVRVVRLTKNADGGFLVDAFGELDLDLKKAGIIEQQRFKSALGQLGGGLVRAAVGIEDTSLRVRRMLLPRMPDRDLLEAIKWNFREQVEGPIDDYVVGFVPLDTIVETGKMTLMAFGVGQKAMKERVELLRPYGLRVVSVEPYATALHAAFDMCGILDDDKYHVCVNVGFTSTQFTLMRRKSLLFARPLSGVSHDALVRNVSKNLNMDYSDAEKNLEMWMMPKNEEEQPKSAYAAQPTDEEKQEKLISNTVSHFFSGLVLEVQRSIDAFCIMYGADRVDAIHLCGDGAFYPGLVEHMQRSLGVKTSNFNPFEKILIEERRQPETMRRASLFAAAVGLAIPC